MLNALLRLCYRRRYIIMDSYTNSYAKKNFFFRSGVALILLFKRHELVLNRQHGVFLLFLYRKHYQKKPLVHNRFTKCRQNTQIGGVLKCFKQKRIIFNRFLFNFLQKGNNIFNNWDFTYFSYFFLVFFFFFSYTFAACVHRHTFFLYNVIISQKIYPYKRKL